MGSPEARKSINEREKPARRKVRVARVKSKDISRKGNRDYGCLSPPANLRSIYQPTIKTKVLNHGKTILREMRGQREAQRFISFIDKYWKFAAGAAVVALAWVWVSALTPHTFTLNEMRDYAVVQLNHVK